MGVKGRKGKGRGRRKKREGKRTGVRGGREV